MNHSAQKRRKRPITVTVSGERGSGKTTLIAVVSAALENSGHHVQKDRFVPNATRAIADLHEQFDVTFVEQYDSLSAVDQMVHESAQLRATIDELRGQVAGLSNENARLRESNLRYAKVDEDLRAANLAYAAENADLRVENHELSRTRVPPQDARRQIDMAFEEVRQAAYVEMERNRLRTQADELKQRARKLGREGDARLESARERMMFALAGGTAARIAEFEPVNEEAYVSAEHASTYYGERIANPFSAADKRRALAAMERSVEEADYERPRTLAEQAQDIYGRTREASATDRLAAANIALMSEDDFNQDTGC